MGGSAGKLADAICGNKAQLQDAFNTYDKDKSGKLSGAESAKFAADAKKVLQGSADPDLRTQIDSADPKQWINKWVDDNGDGSISWTEFVAWAEKLSGGGEGHGGAKKKSSEHGDKKKTKKKKSKKKEKKGSGDEGSGSGSDSESGSDSGSDSSSE